MERPRPDPDELLDLVEAEQRRRRRGRLRVFLGYAAGVGKTYAMLEAAHERRAEGADVVVAYVDTHGRMETERLLEGLEVLPRRSVEYRGATLTDLDLDAVLARRPALALVDELAHTNAPGARHPKRYQDVAEMLDAGIDVYSTLNIQHIESYNDVVAQITGVRVRETVPDVVVDETTDVELIDLPPEELRLRLAEGKVYVPEQAAQAIERFFRPGNLAALREIALRRAATQVDAQMLTYMRTLAIPGPWPAGERLLVGVSASPLSERLVRSAKRLADDLKAEWLALYVETPGVAGRPESRERAMMNLSLAERLGARVHALPGSSVADTLVDYARRNNVTKIVAGKPMRPRWREFLRPSLVDQIIRTSGSIDVYVISSSGAVRETRSHLARRPARAWRRYASALPPVAVATLVGLVIRDLVEPTNLAMLYLAAVVIAAVSLGRGPAILCAFLGVVAFDFFLVPPHYTMGVSDTEYLLTFAGLLVVGLVVGTLAARARGQAQAARRRELQTAELYELSRELSAAGGPQDIERVIHRHVRRSLDGRAVLLTRQDDRLRPVIESEQLSEDELAVATWAVDHGQPAGRGTDTLPGAEMLYLPLRTPREMIGVLGIQLPDPGGALAPSERRIHEAVANLTALALERAQLTAATNQLELLRSRQTLQEALLHSISHELRTPLASITGVLSTLRDIEGHAPSLPAVVPGATTAPDLDAESRAELVETAYEEAEQLNRVVGDLLDMTRLESGALQVVSEPVDVEDLVGASLARMDRRLTRRDVLIDVPSDLPPVVADAGLIVHAVGNLLDNALTYSPEGTPIDIGARVEAGEVWLTVADRGIGIPVEDLETVFDTFFRVPRSSGPAGMDTSSGIGLGLPIARGIIEAHGGRIWAEHRPGGGTIVTVALPSAVEVPA